MPEINKQPVKDFEESFKRWKESFGGPRARPSNQVGPDLYFLKRRLEALEGMEQAFKDMVKKNGF